MTSHDAPKPRRCQGDTGSLIAEMALVAPLLVLLALGVFEYGFLLRNKNVIANGLRSSSRSAAQAKNNDAADLYALQTLMAATGKLKNATVTKVIIYKSTTADGAVPANCVNAVTTGSPPYSVSGSLPCNIYTTANLTPANLVASNFDCATDATAWDKNWCSNIRKIALTDPPDYVGVYAEITYSGITGLLPGKQLVLKDKSVSRIEPNAS
jgi:hypothetical protein